MRVARVVPRALARARRAVSVAVRAVRPVGAAVVAVVARKAFRVLCAGAAVVARAVVREVARVRAERVVDPAVRARRRAVRADLADRVAAAEAVARVVADVGRRVAAAVGVGVDVVREEVFALAFAWRMTELAAPLMVFVRVRLSLSLWRQTVIGSGT